MTSVLDDVISSLDLPPPLFDDAVSVYQEVAAWLGEAGSPLTRLRPDLYPQGSFRLGTPIRPLKEDDDFDIDLVCCLELLKEQTTQADLKNIIGRRLKDHPEYGPIVEERRRCWTIDLATRFHLDVLPSIPDPERRGPHILLTDRELTRWQHSNPIGYAEWFYSRMAAPLKEAREALAKSLNTRVEDVPLWRVRTPLQRAVQLLKRHRDVRYAGPEEHCPVSIIITTLAAKAYDQERTAADAVLRIVERMLERIERRDGKWWVANPAHPEENFADKWNEEPSRKDAFLAWHHKLLEDVRTLAGATTASETRRIAEAVLATASPRERLLMESAVPALEGLSHLAPLKWPEKRQYKCSVNARVYRGQRRKLLFSLAGRFLNKNLDIRFLAATDAPPPYEVKWQVGNTGAEARKASQLRGGFYDGDEEYGKVRWESTKYRGTHVVEALVIKDAKVVARSGRKTVQIV